MSAAHSYPKPAKGKMYGLLHAPDGSALERHVRILKVSFGVPTGPDVHVAMKYDPGKQENVWIVEVGRIENNKRKQDSAGFKTKEEARKFYLEARKTAPDRKYPRKIPYFTFLRMGIDGQYVHDFDVIEQHGPLPTELEIVFLTNEPFDSSYQWWTAAELKCEGDGLNARRKLSEAKTPAEKELAEEAKAAGERFFPIIEGCFTRGCPYPKGDKPVCKPHGRLYFQLVNSPRIGGSCTYDTTGYRSVSQLFSCIQQVKTMTGRGIPERGTVAGIPLKFVMRPYKTSHNGQPSVQFAVSLEFRAASAVEVVRLLNQHSNEFREVSRIEPPPLQLGSGPSEAEVLDPDDSTQSSASFEDEKSEATAMSNEFYGDFEDPVDENEFGESSAFMENAAHEPPIQMPRRKNEAKQQTFDAAPDPG